MPITMPASMSATIADVARIAGRRPVETGGFILGRAGTDRGDVLALTGEVGVERRRDLFIVDGLALAALFDWADDHDLSVIAQWHTHRGRAGLSKTDLEHGLNVPGFHTAVVPFYASASPEPATWGWWTFDRSWKSSAPPRTDAGLSHQTITFEHGAVHEH